ncbi:MAG: L-threonylcarbamoyladenylate synthase [Patescibacteria group bacterium]
MTKLEVIKILKNGGVGIMPTDTIYGLVGQALNKSVVKRICEIKQRPKIKSFIVLISTISDLKKFEIKPDKATLEILHQVWPGPTSVALTAKFAFRLPLQAKLRALIKQTGPLIATSVNPNGLPPAKNIKEARGYFGDRVDFYFAGHKPKSTKPSKLISIQRGKIKIIRP